MATGHRSPRGAAVNKHSLVLVGVSLYLATCCSAGGSGSGTRTRTGSTRTSTPIGLSPTNSRSFRFRGQDRVLITQPLTATGAPSQTSTIPYHGCATVDATIP